LKFLNQNLEIMIFLKEYPEKRSKLVSKSGWVEVKKLKFKSEFVKVKSILTIRNFGFTEGKNIDRSDFWVEFIFICIPDQAAENGHQKY
jgi:hypothetical protein